MGDTGVHIYFCATVYEHASVAGGAVPTSATQGPTSDDDSVGCKNPSGRQKPEGVGALGSARGAGARCLFGTEWRVAAFFL